MRDSLGDWVDYLSRLQVAFLALVAFSLFVTLCVALSNHYGRWLALKDGFQGPSECGWRGCDVSAGVATAKFHGAMSTVAELVAGCVALCLVALPICILLCVLRFL